MRMPTLFKLACIISTLGEVAVAGAYFQQNTRGSDEANLAAQILADQTLREVHQMAKNLLKGGFNAGSGYGEVWIRDLNTFIEVALEVNPPDPVREALLPFFMFQGTNAPYPEGFFKNPQMRSPYSYQNGGDWCWFGGRMIQALIRQGHVAEAYRELRESPCQSASLPPCKPSTALLPIAQHNSS